jgi:predicted outer membrane repeat protein
MRASSFHSVIVALRGPAGIVTASGARVFHAPAHVRWRDGTAYPVRTRRARAPFRPELAAMNPSSQPMRSALALAVGMALAPVALASTVTVTQDADQHISGLCSLREAIESVNTGTAVADTNCGPVALKPGGVVVPFASITLTQGSLVPRGGVWISGTAPGRTRITRDDAAPEFPIFVTGTATFGNAVRLNHLEITHGSPGIVLQDSSVELNDSVVSGNRSSGNGGGISAEQKYGVSLANSTVSGNTAGGAGGGIFAKYVQLVDSTVSGNSSQGPGGGIAIYGYAAGINASNSTIAGNASHGTTGRGGGVYVSEYAQASFSNCTIAGNSGPASLTGAGIFVHGTAEHPPASRLALSSTIVAGNIAGKYYQNIGADLAMVVIGSNDIIGPVAAEVSLPADTQDCNPSLGVLGFGGGPTPTMPLRAGSCAIDHGLANSLANDQRGDGYPRVVGAAADIGAFEYSEFIFRDGFGTND